MIQQKLFFAQTPCFNSRESKNNFWGVQEPETRPEFIPRVFDKLNYSATNRIFFNQKLLDSKIDFRYSIKRKEDDSVVSSYEEVKGRIEAYLTNIANNVRNNSVSLGSPSFEGNVLDEMVDSTFFTDGTSSLRSGNPRYTWKVTFKIPDPEKEGTYLGQEKLEVKITKDGAATKVSIDGNGTGSINPEIMYQKLFSVENQETQVSPKN